MDRFKLFGMENVALNIASEISCQMERYFFVWKTSKREV